MLHDTIRTAIAFALLGTTGCGLLDLNPSSDGGGGVPSGGANGYGKPTLEVTVGGVHFGPAAPDGASAAQLTTSYDQYSNQAVDTRLIVNVSATSVGAACSLGIFRQGEDVAPFTTAGYRFSADSSGPTPDGMAVPISGEGVSVPQGGWSCSGDGCNGGALVITGLDEAHIEGYVGGTFVSNVGGPYEDVVCAFYLPWAVYQP